MKDKKGCIYIARRKQIKLSELLGGVLLGGSMDTQGKSIAQFLAIKQGTKKKSTRNMSELHKKSNNESLYNGHSKKWEKVNEDGEEFPQDSKSVILDFRKVIASVVEGESAFLDIEATIEKGNTLAKADVIVNGVAIIKDMTPTGLLSLEKRLVDYKTLFSKLPTLSLDKEWSLDPNTNLYRSDVVKTHKTKKTTEWQTVSPATEFHQAIVKEIVRDPIIGYWNTTSYSGAIPIPMKESILDNLELLINAVREARTKANQSTKLEGVEIAKDLFGFIFSGVK